MPWHTETLILTHMFSSCVTLDDLFTCTSISLSKMDFVDMLTLLIGEQSVVFGKLLYIKFFFRNIGQH